MNDVTVAYAAFLKESIRFLLAQNYFLVAANVGMEGNQHIAERHKNFDEVVTPEYRDGFTYVSAQLFVSFISSFEVFLQQVIAAVVKRNPKKLGGVQFRLADILDVSDNDELVDKAIDEHLNKLMYKKPMEYLQDVCDLLSIDRRAFDDLWPVYVEAKARRDLGVHAAWKCNATYLRKMIEAGLTPTLKLGDSAVPDDGEYLQPLGAKLRELADRIATSVNEKHAA